MTILSRCTLAAIVLALPIEADDACQVDTPCYSAASVVNAASYQSGWFGPNTFASIFGQSLSRVTANGPPNPDESLGGVQVEVNGESVYVSYVSPTQVNFVVPARVTGATVNVQLVRDNVAGPLLTLPLHDSAPSLFELDPATVIANHADWTVVTEQSPAQPGEQLEIFATGLGGYQTPIPDTERPPTIDWLARSSEFKVYLDGQPVDSSLIYYVGAELVSVGVIQIDFQLPSWVGPNPEIRIALSDPVLGDRLSPPGLVLPVE